MIRVFNVLTCQMLILLLLCSCGGGTSSGTAGANENGINLPETAETAESYSYDSFIEAGKFIGIGGNGKEAKEGKEGIEGADGGGAGKELNANAGEDGNSLSSGSKPVTIKVSGGLLRGSRQDGICRFLGVPYAHAMKRFRMAEPLTPWDGIIECASYGAISPQGQFLGNMYYDAGEGTSNDCLNLNIWTPGSDDKRRPVMVWLHGGGFSMGSANERIMDGEKLSRRGNVVVIGINHRLGVFGHLNLSAYGADYTNSANIGLLDIILALRYIKENAEVFGGDPGNITLFGQSGGGAKILALMACPYAEGLFHKAILQSGVLENMGIHFETPERSEELSRRIVDKLCETYEWNQEDILAGLENVSAGELLMAANIAQSEIAKEQKIPMVLGASGNGISPESATEYTPESATEYTPEYATEYNPKYAMEWLPVVDGEVLTQEPITEKGFIESAKDISIIIGSNLNEGLALYKEEDLRASGLSIDKISERTGASEAEIVQAYILAYPNEDPDLCSWVDTDFRLPALKVMSHKAEQGGAPVYAYVFTKGDKNGMSGHGAELPYVFNSLPLSEKDESLAEAIEDLWTSFARTGVPEAEWMPEWKVYDRTEGATLLIDDTPMLRKKHDRELLQILKPDYNYWPEEKASDVITDPAVTALIDSYAEKALSGRKNLDFTDPKLDPGTLSAFSTGAKNEFSLQCYTGDNYISVISESGDSLPVFTATYAPGVVSFWHTHTALSGGGQVLIGTAGTGLCEIEGGEIKEIKPGDVIIIPAGKRHWHGAGQDTWFQMIEIMLPGEGMNISWYEHP